MDLWWKKHQPLNLFGDNTSPPCESDCEEVTIDGIHRPSIRITIGAEILRQPSRLGRCSLVPEHFRSRGRFRAFVALRRETNNRAQNAARKNDFEVVSVLHLGYEKS